MDTQAIISGLRFLGLSGSDLPSEAELKAAYHKKAMEYHPDRPHNHDQQVDAAEQFKELNAHYEYLLELINSCWS